MVHDVRALAELRDRVVLDRPAQVAARLERDADPVARRHKPDAGGLRDPVAGMVEVRDMWHGQVSTCGTA